MLRRTLQYQLRRLQSRSMSTREQMEYDVLTVGAGPAGLAAAIRLKQLANEAEVDLNVCVVEKGAEVGAHILSGNVFEPRALNELFPNWQELGAPLETKVSSDSFLVLTENGSLTLPNFLLPSELHNDGNYVISLSQLVRWLGERAEELGVEVYPGFAASEILYSEDGKSVRGIATKEVGIAKDGSQKATYEDGMELLAKQTLFAEGARGSCSEELIEKFQLRGPETDEQTYGLGIKEVWQIPEDKCKPGLVQHTLGWPLQDSMFSKTFGGTFLYHQAPNLVQVGMVVGLDYENPYLSPYKEFQRWKHHPEVAKHFEDGECIAYGARVLNEGGLHAIPKLTFPGGALIGCSAGFLNAVKIKGSHTALKSGMLAAEAVFPLVCGEEDNLDENVKEAVEYENAIKGSWIYDELKRIRNTHSSFKWGTLPGLVYTAFSCFITGGNEPWTFSNKIPDHAKTKSAENFVEIKYPKPDGVLSFDLLTNLQRSGTSHDHDQPAHLRIKEDKADVPSQTSIKKYAGPEQRFCPAGVYEYTEPDAEGNQKLVINAQNCVHCKCCSIKCPEGYIKWTVPEGGGGPAYMVM